MKFRATILNAGHMRQFSSIINVLCKLSKTFILRICDENIYFLVCEQNNLVKLWCIFNKQFFHTYSMVGCGTKNEIQLQVPSDVMSFVLNSLKSGSSVTSMKIKLTDKMSPCLTFSFELVSQEDRTQICVHNVEVLIIQSADWVEFKDPSEIDYDVSMQVPNIKLLHNMIERLKKVNNKIQLHAKKPNCLSLSMDAVACTIEVLFPNMLSTTVDELDENVCVSVDVKRFAQFLSCAAPLNAALVTCNLISNRMLYIYMENDLFRVHYYITSIED